MKSRIFSIVLLLFTMLSLHAQTYELRDWNRSVVTKVNNGNASVGRRFTNRNQVVFQGANRGSGWIFAIQVGNNREGLVIRSCGINGCVPSAQRVVAGNQHELITMSIADILSLADQQSNLQTTTRSAVLRTDKTATNVDLIKEDKANADVIRADKASTMQKTTVPNNTNVNLNKANTKVIRQ